MDVRCPQCETLYELDDEQVSNRPVTLKCSQCQHLFRLEGRVAISQENQRRWMIRRQGSGDILYLNSFEVLHEWIMKQEVHTDDEISRTGNKWVELGEIGEFTPLFQVVESITQLGADLEGRSDVSSIATRMTPDSSSSQPAAKPPIAEESSPRERVRTSIQYGGTDAPADGSGPMRTEDVTKKVGPRGPAPNELPPSPRADEEPTKRTGSSPRPAPQPGRTPSTTPGPSVAAGPPADPSEDEFAVDLSQEIDTAVAEPPPKSSGGLLVFLGILVLVAGGGYVWFFNPELIGRGASEEPDVVPIVEKEEKPPVDPEEALDGAIARALEAAESENDAIWTMWYETASEPFYVALDTAYAEADEASIDVELDEKVAEARRMLENGRLKQATTLFQQVLAREPNNPAAITGMGWTLLELGRAKEAAQRFQQSMDLDPAYGDAYIGLGSAQRRLGNLKAAYDAYDLYLGRFPRGAKASIASYQMSQLRKQLGM
jgi:predicted Zn finger-like uncharacterized protein